MPSNDETDRTTGGLSTDDLAQPAAGGSGADREAPPTGAPVYPGESTAPAGTGRPDGDSAADGTGTGTGTGAQAPTPAPAPAPSPWPRPGPHGPPAPRTTRCRSC